MTLSRDEKMALYQELVSRYPDLIVKGKANPYTSMNGNMFAFLGKDDTLAFRVSKERREEFLAQHPDSMVVSYKTVMKDYIGVPEEMLSDLDAVQALFSETVAHARTLNPKPTTKPKR